MWDKHLEGKRLFFGTVAGISGAVGFVPGAIALGFIAGVTQAGAWAYGVVDDGAMLKRQSGHLRQNSAFR